MFQAEAAFNHALPILTVDLVEERFRFTATVTAGAQGLWRMASARSPLRGVRDPFADMIMDRAPHVAEQSGLIARRRLALDRRPSPAPYREPICLSLR